MAIPVAFTLMAGPETKVPAITAMAIPILMGIPIAFTVANVLLSPRQARSIGHLAFLHAQIVVVFGVAYFFVVSFHRNHQLARPPSGDGPGMSAAAGPAITGIPGRWVDAMKTPPRDSRGRAFVLRTYLGELHDCLHFSLVTSATVGYGDMAPVSRRARILVDLQIAMTIFFVTLAIGSFFVNQPSRQESHRQ